MDRKSVNQKHPDIHFNAEQNLSKPVYQTAQLRHALCPVNEGPHLETIDCIHELTEAFITYFVVHISNILTQFWATLHLHIAVLLVRSLFFWCNFVDRDKLLIYNELTVS